MPGRVWLRVRWARIYRRRKNRAEVVAADELVELTQKQKNTLQSAGCFFADSKDDFDL